MDDSELQEMIERADNDNDGLVTFEDFYHIMTKKTFSWLSLLVLINTSLFLYLFIFQIS